MYRLFQILPCAQLSWLCLYATVHAASATPIEKQQQPAHSNPAQAQEPQVNVPTGQALRQQPFLFNPQSLYGSNRDVDLQAFNRAHYIAPGLYSVAVRVNQNPIGELQVLFHQSQTADSAVLCLDQQLLGQLDLKPAVLQALKHSLLQRQPACLSFQALAPEADYAFNLQQLKLDLSIPLLVLQQHPEGYIAAERFQQGVNSAFVAYNANHYWSEQQGSQYLSLNAGLNLGAWYFRHAGFFQSSPATALETDHSHRMRGLGRYQSNLNTLYHDIDRLQSRLSLGEFYTQNSIGDNIAMRGVQLASDDNMLPWSMRSYAPVIKDVVPRNALVRVFQNGQKIYEKTVPAGPFELQDLSTQSSGDLRVEIIAQGGETRVLHLPMQLNFDLLKKGRFQYSAALGHLKLANTVSRDYLSQASLSYGMSNWLTLRAGLTYADLYRSALLSSTMNTALGGFKLAVEHSQATDRTQQQRGQKYQFKYHYFWQPQRLSLSLTAATQSRDYQLAHQALSWLYVDQLNKAEYDYLWRTHQLKNQYALMLSQSFQNSHWGAIQANLLRQQYRRSRGDDRQYMLNYSNRWRRVNYSLGFSRSMQALGHSQYRQELRYYASISLPLDWRKHHLYLSNTLQRSEYKDKAPRAEQSSNTQPYSGRYTQLNTQISATLGQDNQFNFGLGFNRNLTQNYADNEHDHARHQAYQANMSYLHPYIHLASTGYYDGTAAQYSLSARGAWVAHRYGITATHSMPTTFSIIRVDQAKNIKLNAARGVRINRFGHAIYSHHSPYSKNIIQIDPVNLPLSMSLKASQATVIPRQYSSTLVNFSVQQSALYILRLHSAQGILPMGAEIRNATQQIIGHLGQSNQAILDQFDPKRDRQLSLHWGNKQQQHCQMQLPPVMENKKQAFQIIQVECR